jgi:hypothetical protein
MKKLLVSLVAAAPLALGLVGISSSPAQADCPYTGCIRTETTMLSGPTDIERGTAPTYKIGVEPKAGSGTVHGTVVIKCHRDGFRAKTGTGMLDNGKTTIGMPRFKRPGNWDCTARYIRHGKFLGSSTSWNLHVG